ncbi:pancreatic triacylglycerol lipase [Patagioenas fasciata monilis]|uniref:Triacylglycerol lipase n=1 Tax=Patagioenas fasciata monilis TaxID=372326 RepID=A0A1V4KI99_PATFA|nr:pancreatic triacylglycerol lipase [Patagioenas fasciata monilis]
MSSEGRKSAVLLPSSSSEDFCKAWCNQLRGGPKELARSFAKMFVVWITTLLLLNEARGRQVCYERLGCFTDIPPWSGIPGRQLAGLPSSPEDVNTSFFLFTKDNIINYQLMLLTEDVNCILADWTGGSSGLYTTAVNNVRIVGAELVYLVNFLEKDYGYSLANIHFIGHSLGAHAAGEAGRRKPGIGRITGLDPAGPLFQYTPTMVRLDPSDAKFVDIIHTHAGHLFFDFAPGILQTSGHLDFYPNGGKKMPGCKQLRVPPATRDINDLMREYRSIACGHKRSLRYYAESIITPNGFVGYHCKTYRAFVLGNCFPCPKEGCPLMGHYADRFSNKTEKEEQKIYLNTGACPPYARWRKEIHVRVSATEIMKGNIDVALTGTNGIRKEYRIDKGTFKPGNTYLNYIDTEISGNISKVEFLWKKHVGHRGYMGAEKVTIVSGENGNVERDKKGDKRMVVGIWIIALYLLGTVAGDEVCYSRLGCFSDGPPWSGVPGRHLTGLPDPPEKMNISFSLYTRETGNNSQVLLEVENANCIAVDWKDGAKGSYVSAVNNIRVIGAEIAYFLKILQGHCFPCSQERCPMMGYYADRFPDRLKMVNQKYFLNTAANPPFTTWRQKVFIKLSGVKKTRGSIYLAFHDTEGNAKEYEIASGVLSQDQVYTKYLDVEVNPKNTNKMDFFWNKTVYTLLWARLGAETVNIIHGEDGHM